MEQAPPQHVSGPLTLPHRYLPSLSLRFLIHKVGIKPSATSLGFSGSMSSDLSPRWLCPGALLPTEGLTHELGQGVRATCFSGYCEDHGWEGPCPGPLQAQGLLPFSHPRGPCLQPAGPAAGAAGPPQCPALPRPQQAALLRGSPRPSAVCRCNCTCVACRTAPVICAANFSNCESSRYWRLAPCPIPSSPSPIDPTHSCRTPSPQVSSHPLRPHRNPLRFPRPSANPFSHYPALSSCLLAESPLALVPLTALTFPFPE